MFDVTRRILLLIGTILFLFCIPVSCDQLQFKPVISDCPPCPNNTTCMDGDCGCPPEWYDMGSWCLQKHPNLFVAACPDCPCLDVIGLYLLDIIPEPGSGFTPLSQYSIVGREGNNGYNASGTNANFSYFERPDGDSIAIYSIPIPGINVYYRCRINDLLTCEIDIKGKFHGTDTIETSVFWKRCRTDSGSGSNFIQSKQLTFVRWK